jgi:hypothetical protein
MSLIAIASLILPEIIQATRKGQSAWSIAPSSQKNLWVEMTLQHLLPQYDNPMQLVKGLYEVFEYNGLFKGREEIFPDFLIANKGIIDKAVQMINSKPQIEAAKKKADEQKIIADRKTKKTAIVVVSILALIVVIYMIW